MCASVSPSGQVWFLSSTGLPSFDPTGALFVASACHGLSYTATVLTTLKSAAVRAGLGAMADGSRTKGRRRSALKVDFWMLRTVPFEANMFARRLPVTLFGEPAWIATAEDTVLHKLYWNGITPSERQVGDAAGIVAVQGAELDRDYLERWARELGVATVLLDLLNGKIRPKCT